MRLGPPDGRLRWLPRHGQPRCVIEWITQVSVKLLAWLPLYIAVIATLTLLVVVFGMPFGWGQ